MCQMKNLVILLLISTNLFSQVIVVHSKNDKRLLAYKDSMECYLHGLREVDVAKKIKNREDTAEGRVSYNYINKFYLKLNQNIKPILTVRNLDVAHKIKIDGYYLTTYIWYPELWQKPVCRVIYEPIKQIVKTDTVKPPKKNVFIYTLNGQTVSREQFERFYGRKTKTEN